MDEVQWRVVRVVDGLRDPNDRIFRSSPLPQRPDRWPFGRRLDLIQSMIDGVPLGVVVVTYVQSAEGGSTQSVLVDGASRVRMLLQLNSPIPWAAIDLERGMAVAWNGASPEVHLPVAALLHSTQFHAWKSFCNPALENVVKAESYVAQMATATFTEALLPLGSRYELSTLDPNHYLALLRERVQW